jgi:hypothetical protein
MTVFAGEKAQFFRATRIEKELHGPPSQARVWSQHLHFSISECIETGKSILSGIVSCSQSSDNETPTLCPTLSAPDALISVIFYRGGAHSEQCLILRKWFKGLIRKRGQIVIAKASNRLNHKTRSFGLSKPLALGSKPLSPVH